LPPLVEPGSATIERSSSGQPPEPTRLCLSGMLGDLTDQETGPDHNWSVSRPAVHAVPLATVRSNASCALSTAVPFRGARVAMARGAVQHGGSAWTRGGQFSSPRHCLYCRLWLPSRGPAGVGGFARRRSARLHIDQRSAQSRHDLNSPQIRV
jgi:hypothetical protein